MIVSKIPTVKQHTQPRTRSLYESEMPQLVRGGRVVSRRSAKANPTKRAERPNGAHISIPWPGSPPSPLPGIETGTFGAFLNRSMLLPDPCVSAAGRGDAKRLLVFIVRTRAPLVEHR